MTTTAGGIPLTVLAGLPSSLQDAVKGKLERHYRAFDGNALRAFEFLSGLREGGEYRSRAIKSSLEALGKRIQAKKRKNERQENPTHLSMVFLESFKESENDLLLESFFAFAQCVKIQRTDRQWSSYTADELKDFFIEAIDTMPSRSDTQGLKYVFLPLEHFLLAEKRTLLTECFERVKNFPQESPIVKEIIPFELCAHKRCDHCPHKARTDRPVDARGLCFVSSARDGSPYGANKIWENLQTTEADEKIYYSKVFLSAYYRFGVPILPGTHFDVQYPGRKKIAKNMFYCPQRKKRVPKKQSVYVNIYPNGTINTPIA